MSTSLRHENCKRRVLPRHTLQLPRSKAVSVGVGFLCQDGIVICADTQITWPENHKYYECKIYPYGGTHWTAATTFAGNPELMKSFDGKFRESMELMPAPYTASRIQDNIETILSFLDILKDDPMQLSLLFGIVIPNKEFRLLKAEGRIVRPVPRFDYVGVGDSSLLRYLAPLLTQTGQYTSKQALNIATYLVLQAKRYVDGCGGSTDGRVLQPNGMAPRIDGLERMEQKFFLLEHQLGRLAAYFFDNREPATEVDQAAERFVKMLKDYRPEIGR